MTNPGQVQAFNYTIDGMSTNLILEFRGNGEIWGKITRPRIYLLTDAVPGILYINGILYTVASYTFVKIVPV